jgi:hypothetical protein
MLRLRVTAGRPGVELTDDARFARRVRRLTYTSAVVLGLLFVLWTLTLNAHPATGVGLVLGWILMPSILWLSLRRPWLRYALTLPASVVSIALLLICLTALPDNRLASAGWFMITAGVLLGGSLGIWFWFRMLPVPAVLHDPFSPGRWLLVGAHIGLILCGLLLVMLSA